MSYETRAYDKPNTYGFSPDPVVVIVATGTHDVSRLVHLLSRGNCEQVDLGEHVLRQVKRHNGGRAALKLLAAHGGPDLLTKVGKVATPYCEYGYPIGGVRPGVRWCSLNQGHGGMHFGADDDQGFTDASTVRRSAR
jgi:hypothetical protein